MKLLIAGVLGGIVIFLWGMVSWMVLPWHKDTINHFKDERSVAAVVTANISKSGMYIMPAGEMEGVEAHQANMPMIFASISLDGMKPMGGYMMTGIINQILAAILVAFLVSKVSLGYLGRVGFIVMLALTAGLITNGPYWNWFSFDTQFTLVTFGDILISWFLAGLVIAKFARK